MLKNNNFINAIIVILYTMLIFILENFIFNDCILLFDKIIIYIILSTLIITYLIIGKKKFFELLHKYRYIFCILIISYLVIMNYNTSSINMYNFYIQPNLPIEDTTLIGNIQPIRSDEWAVSTPSKISQSTILNKYHEYNYTMMAKKGAVTIQPKLPTKTLHSLTTISFIGYFILPVDRALSLDCFLEFILLIFISYDFCLIISNNKKNYALLGALLIGFSPALLWWNSYSIVLYGEMAIVFFNNILTRKRKKIKIINSILLGWSGACYIMTMYPAWMVPYAYGFLALIIYLLIQNKKKYKIKELIPYLLLAILIIIILVAPNFILSKDIVKIINNTSYPGHRIDNGKLLFKHYLINYIGVPFYSVKYVENASLLSQYISFFPIPLIISIIYLLKDLKKRKVDWLTTLMIIVSFIIIIYLLFDIPIFAKYTLLSFSTTIRAQLVLGYFSIILLIRNMAIYEYSENLINYKNIIKIFLAIVSVILLVNIYDRFNVGYLTLEMKILIYIFYIVNIILIIVNNKKINKFLLITLGIPVAFIGLLILPISKGIDVITEKPVAKKVQEIVKEDKKAIWLTVEESFVVANYLVANGAKTLNSTNYYPNFDFWHKIDSSKKYESIYNRYSHIQISLTNDKSTIELIQTDLIKLNLNINKLKDLNVKYIYTSANLSQFDTEDIQFNLIYQEDNANIYKLRY